MQNTLRYVCVACVVIINVAVAGSLSVLAWLGSNWMTGHQARNWLPYDWLCAAFERALYWLVIALVVGGVCGVVNWPALNRLFPKRTGLPWFLAGVDCLVIAFGGLVGSIFFYVEKPWMRTQEG
jgi:hypothetical protein